jgi:haloacid dehalogenase-like hydrolase
MVISICLFCRNYFSLARLRWQLPPLLRPFWEEAIDGRARVVQAVPDMLEIVPPQTSKGKGVKMLLDHLGVSPNEVLVLYPSIYKKKVCANFLPMTPTIMKTLLDC